MCIIKTGQLLDVIDNLESTMNEVDYEVISIKADSITDDSFLLHDPVLFIPELGLFAVCMEYCTDEMADWSGTFIFRIDNMSGEPQITNYCYESDDIMTTLHNYTQLNVNKLSTLYAGTFTEDLSLVSELLESALMEINYEQEAEPLSEVMISC